MSKIKVEVEVEKETYEVAQAVSELVVGLIQKKSIAELAAGELMKLQAAVDGFTQVPGELADDPGAFARAIANPLCDVLSAAKAK